MKKKILSIILALTLCIGSGNIFTAQASAADITQEDLSAYAETFENITPVDVPLSTGLTYGEDFMAGGGTIHITSDLTEYVVPVNVKSGYFDCAIALEQSLDDGYFDLYVLDKDLNILGKEMLYGNGKEIGMQLEEGKYYIYLVRGSGCTAEITGNFQATTFNSSDLTIPSDKYVIGYIEDSDDARYIKFTAEKDGLLFVSLMQTDGLFLGSILGLKEPFGDSGVTFTLCSDKKKALTGKEYTFSSDEYIKTYAVRKGTYYLKVEGVFKATYAVGVIISNGTAMGKNTTKEKAVTLNNKAKTVVLGVGSGSAFWYKFAISTPKKATISMAYLGGNGWVDVTVYKGSTKIYSGHLYSEANTLDIRNEKNGKAIAWSKGTYYIKINKDESSDNSIVSLVLK